MICPRQAQGVKTSCAPLEDGGEGCIVASLPPAGRKSSYIIPRTVLGVEYLLVCGIPHRDQGGCSIDPLLPGAPRIDMPQGPKHLPIWGTKFSGVI